VRSWHDYQIVGYRVDGERDQLFLELRWKEGTRVDVPQADLTFSGVSDYLLQHDLGGNIVFSIDESSIEEFVRENAEYFEGTKKWGWPRSWRGDAAKTIHHLQAAGKRVWLLSSSYGLRGWVVADDVQERAVSKV